MRVVFFGTPEFAVPSLEALLGEGFDVVAAVTQPDKPQGRSRSTAVSPPVQKAAAAGPGPAAETPRPTEPGLIQRPRRLTRDRRVGVSDRHIHTTGPLALP